MADQQETRAMLRARLDAKFRQQAGWKPAPPPPPPPRGKDPGFDEEFTTSEAPIERYPVNALAAQAHPDAVELDVQPEPEGDRTVSYGDLSRMPSEEAANIVRASNALCRLSDESLLIAHSEIVQRFKNRLAQAEKTFESVTRMEQEMLSNIQIAKREAHASILNLRQILRQLGALEN